MGVQTRKGAQCKMQQNLDNPELLNKSRSVTSLAVTSSHRICLFVLIGTTRAIGCWRVTFAINAGPLGRLYG